MSIPIKQHSTDQVQDKDFLNAYKRLPEKSASTIRFFDRGDYFSLHGSDALFAAKEHFKTNNVIKIWKSGSQELETCYVNTNNFEIFLKDLLLIKQYRVEIWRKSKSGDWTLSNHGSPGNISQFEDIIYKNEDDQTTSNQISDPSIIAIQIGVEDKINKLTCAYIEKTSRTFLTCTISFKDNLTDLESLLIHLSPKECLIPNNIANRDYHTKLVKCLERNNCLVTERKKSDFNAEHSCDELNKLVKTSGDQNVANVVVELKDLMMVGCLNALVRFLDLLADSSNEKKFKIKPYNLNNYLKLDSGAFRSLNLLPSGKESATGSVYGVLNRCCTVQGQRLLMQWIKQPLVDIHKIEERQNIVELLVNDAELRQNLIESYLKRMPDIQKIEWRFIKEKANLQDCYKIYLAVEQLPKMYETLLGANEAKNSFIVRELFTNPLNVLISDLSKFQSMIESTIDFDQIKNHMYLIKSSFVPELSELREKLDEYEQRVVAVAEKLADELKLKTIKLESSAQQGFYLRVPRKDDSVIRNNKSLFIMDTKKDGIRFQNEKIQRINESFIAVKEEYEEKQNSVVQELIRVASGYLDSLQVLNNLLAELDIYTSLAQVAVSSQNDYIRPKLYPMGHGLLRLKASRHPCLELQEGINFIPNDCEFVRDEKTFCIITGPNMGGKSTFARQVGAILIMAQLGSFVPASQAEISIVDCILARIGANDCQNKGLSTFMAEMLETSFILKTATRNSFVIIDELGRGTSTYDGFGLAWAISDYLARKVECFTIFATHFHELTALSDELKTVFNCHVSAVTNDEELTLLYKVVPGVCDQSFGIHVAKLANFPDHVIQFAKEKAKYLEDYCPLFMSEMNEVDNSQKLKYKEEANDLICECFGRLKKEDLSKLSDEELVKRVNEEILAESNSHNNPYFKMLINK